MAEPVTKKSWLPLVIGLGIGLTLSIGILLGTFASSWRGPQMLFPETQLRAMATDGDDSFAIATGMISEDTEGIFFLEFETGALTCAVIYPKTGQFGARFMTNVTADLQPSKQKKNQKYLMVTGVAGARGGFTGNVRPASSVVYILDPGTGEFACYTMPWNRQAANMGQPQEAPMQLVYKGVVGQLGGDRGAVINNR